MYGVVSWMKRLKDAAQRTYFYMLSVFILMTSYIVLRVCVGLLSFVRQSLRLMSNEKLSSIDSVGSFFPS